MPNATTIPILLTKAQVCERLSLSPRTLEAMVKNGTFPPPVRMGKFVYWTEAVVAQWMVRYFGTQAAWAP